LAHQPLYAHTGCVVLTVGQKVIVFGHHKIMLDGIQEKLGKPYQAMRIDGSTSMELRKKAMDDFQQKPSVRLAILSITAAGVCQQPLIAWDPFNGVNPMNGAGV